MKKKIQAIQKITSPTNNVGKKIIYRIKYNKLISPKRNNRVNN